jgi:hypothetical protein
LHVSNYNDRPSRLFDGLEHIRLSIHLIGRSSSEPKTHSTTYYKWYSEERSTLFEKIQYVSMPSKLITSSVSKIGSEVERKIADCLLRQKRPIVSYTSRGGNHAVLYTRKVGNYLQILNFVPRITDGMSQLRLPSELKELKFADMQLATIALGCLNSSLFYWYFSAISDCRNLNKRDIEAFPMKIDDIAKSAYGKEFVDVTLRLMDDFARKSEVRTMRFKHDTLTVQCIIPKFSKKIIDGIDDLLANFTGLNSSEPQASPHFCG